MRLIPIFVGAIASIAGDLATAEACSRPCQPGYFVPADGSSVPANIPALYWQPRDPYGQSPINPSLVTLVDTTNPTVPIPITKTQVAGTRHFLIVPDQPLAVGASYLLADQNTCDFPSSPPPSVTFATAPAAPLPSALGALMVSPNVRDLLEVPASAICSAIVAAEYATITLELAPEAMLWRDALHFETLVDGVPWWGPILTEPWPPQGRSAAIVYRVCYTDDPGLVEPGLDTSVHQVTMRATLPGSDVVLTTSPMAVQLECLPTWQPDPPPEEEPTAGGGCSTSKSLAPPWLALATALGLVRRRRRRG